MGTEALSQASPVLIFTGRRHHAEAIVEDSFVEREMSGIERVRLLGCLMARERAVFAPIASSDIDALPLNEMASQANPRIFIVQCTQRDRKSVV